MVGRPEAIDRQEEREERNVKIIFHGGNGYGGAADDG